jgi:DNA-binding NarL/FixJ family response regulator
VAEDNPGIASMNASIRVLVVDDHALLRRGVAAVLADEPDIEVIGEAADGKEALRLAPLLLPDLVLMDVAMPEMDGIEATSAIFDQVPSTRVVMLTRSDDEADLYAAVRAGACGYLLKDMAVEELPDAIRVVHSGQSLISPRMASKLLTEFASMIKRTDQHQQPPGARLTDREIEVLGLVARGLNNRDIARKLYISENTVKNHVRNILEKFQLHSRMEAVVYAVREKLLEIT